MSHKWVRFTKNNLVEYNILKYYDDEYEFCKNCKLLRGSVGEDFGYFIEFGDADAFFREENVPSCNTVIMENILR